MQDTVEKTDRQQLLEFRHGKPLKEVIEECLEKHRGKRHTIATAAVELGLSYTTLTKWATEMEVNFRAYRKKPRPHSRDAAGKGQ